MDNFKKATRWMAHFHGKPVMLHVVFLDGNLQKEEELSGWAVAAGAGSLNIFCGELDHHPYILAHIPRIYYHERTRIKELSAGDATILRLTGKLIPRPETQIAPNLIRLIRFIQNENRNNQ